MTINENDAWMSEVGFENAEAMIVWLLSSSDVTHYRIANDLGISQSTLSRINNKKQDLDALNYGTLKMLYTYAVNLKEKRGILNEAKSNL